jgi:hypothetical protein
VQDKLSAEAIAGADAFYAASMSLEDKADELQQAADDNRARAGKIRAFFA